MLQECTAEESNVLWWYDGHDPIDFIMVTDHVQNVHTNQRKLILLHKTCK
jgi:hypothetical protein